jgi:hypothetical protein
MVRIWQDWLKKNPCTKTLPAIIPLALKPLSRGATRGRIGLDQMP